MSKEETKKILNKVYSTMQVKGFDASKQIVGYLSSGDPGYIPSVDNARGLMISLDRQEVLKMILEEFLN